jgi:hypothetical protein
MAFYSPRLRSTLVREQMMRGNPQGAGLAIPQLLLGLAQMAGAVVSGALIAGQGLTALTLGLALLTTCLTLYSRSRTRRSPARS